MIENAVKKSPARREPMHDHYDDEINLVDILSVFGNGASRLSLSSHCFSFALAAIYTFYKDTFV